MVQAGVVPEHEIPVLPLVRIAPGGIGEHEAEELIQQRLGLHVLHILDAYGEARRDTERGNACFGMGAHHRLHHGFRLLFPTLVIIDGRLALGRNRHARIQGFRHMMNRVAARDLALQRLGQGRIDLGCVDEFRIAALQGVLHGIEHGDAAGVGHVGGIRVPEVPGVHDAHLRPIRPALVGEDQHVIVIGVAIGAAVLGFEAAPLAGERRLGLGGEMLIADAQDRMISEGLLKRGEILRRGGGAAIKANDLSRACG